MKTFPLRIGTPDGLLFEGNVVRVVCRTITGDLAVLADHCLLYTSPSPRDGLLSRMPSSA